MSDNVIKVENLSKLYRLGEVGTGTLSHDLNRWWHKWRGKEDPYQKIGEKNNRTLESNLQYTWALKDINFEVKRGEILGIIGNNGAGKSTILKILSKITGPTTGRFRAKGRIASLLEVGTGFHYELTGRENIYLNGAILGMSKNEIKKKLDSIVNFAGVARYLDTPVKRYSSGMIVRLGFSIAAHLEPEILIVDEVLAVGDAEFQKKCLNKLDNISTGEGRTVIFVSHDLLAVKKLCTRCLLLDQGHIKKIGEVDNIVDIYIDSSSRESNSTQRYKIPNETDLDAYIDEVTFVDNEGNLFKNAIPLGAKWKIKLSININSIINDFRVGVGFALPAGIPLRTSWSPPRTIQPGKYMFTFSENNLSLKAGSYPVYLGLSTQKTKIQYIEGTIYLRISDSSIIHELIPDNNQITNYRNNLILNQLKCDIDKIG